MANACGSAAGSRAGTARSGLGTADGSRPRQGTAGSAGLFSGGGRVTFSRRTARLKQGQAQPAVFDPTRMYASLPMFSSCSLDFLRCLQELGGPLTRHGKIYEPDTMIAVEKQLGESMWIVHRGELELLKGLKRVNTIRDRDCFGERVLLGLEPRYTMSVRTVMMSHLFEINCVAFMQTLMRYPFERHQFERAGPTNEKTDETTERQNVSSSGQRRSRSQGKGELQADTLHEEHHPLRDIIVKAERQDEDDTTDKRLAEWRDRRRSLTKDANDADLEQFIDQVKRSLRTDHRRGFRMPNIAERRPSKTADHLEEASPGGTHEENRLEIGLLPPLSSMTPLQKRMVQRQLEHRVQARKRIRGAGQRLAQMRKLAITLPDEEKEKEKGGSKPAPLLPGVADGPHAPASWMAGATPSNARLPALGNRLLV